MPQQPNDQVQDQNQNPLNLTTEYIWQTGDTMATIACKYRRQDQVLELIELNKWYLFECRGLSKAGDKIKIPEDWFPLPQWGYETKLKGSSGYRFNEGL